MNDPDLIQEVIHSVPHLEPDAFALLDQRSELTGTLALRGDPSWIDRVAAAGMIFQLDMSPVEGGGGTSSARAEITAGHAAWPFTIGLKNLSPGYYRIRLGLAIPGKGIRPAVPLSSGRLMRPRTGNPRTSP